MAQQEGKWRAGDKAEYWSASKNFWIVAKVLDVNPDGSYKLNCKSHAKAKHMRYHKEEANAEEAGEPQLAATTNGATRAGDPRSPEVPSEDALRRRHAALRRGSRSRDRAAAPEGGAVSRHESRLPSPARVSSLPQVARGLSRSPPRRAGSPPPRRACSREAPPKRPGSRSPPARKVFVEDSFSERRTSPARRAPTPPRPPRRGHSRSPPKRAPSAARDPRTRDPRPRDARPDDPPKRGASREPRPRDLRPNDPRPEDPQRRVASRSPRKAGHGGRSPPRRRSRSRSPRGPPPAAREPPPAKTPERSLDSLQPYASASPGAPPPAGGPPTSWDGPGVWRPPTDRPPAEWAGPPPSPMANYAPPPQDSQDRKRRSRSRSRRRRSRDARDRKDDPRDRKDDTRDRKDRERERDRRRSRSRRREPSRKRGDRRRSRSRRGRRSRSRGGHRDARDGERRRSRDRPATAPPGAWYPPTGPPSGHPPPSHLGYGPPRGAPAPPPGLGRFAARAMPRLPPPPGPLPPPPGAPPFSTDVSKGKGTGKEGKGKEGKGKKGKGKAEDWKCENPNCGETVFASKTSCFKCGTPKGKTEPDAKGKGKGEKGPYPNVPAAPGKYSEDKWEQPREEIGLRLISEDAQAMCPGARWQYAVNDASRRSFAAHMKNPFTEEMCKHFFNNVKEMTNWHQPEGPHGPIPRKTAWMVADGCNCTYRYGSIEVEPQVFPPFMKELMKVIMPMFGCATEAQWPNSCNMNIYEDGESSVGWHSDDERIFQGKFQDIRILSLSLGQKRKFQLRANHPEAGERPVHTFMLGNGDLCTMEGMMQKHYQHRVPKEGGIQEPRINLTWRWNVKHNPRCPAGRMRR